MITLEENCLSRFIFCIFQLLQASGRGIKQAYIHLLQAPTAVQSVELPPDAAKHNEEQRRLHHTSKLCTESKTVAAAAAIDALDVVASAADSATADSAAASAAAVVTSSAAPPDSSNRKTTKRRSRKAQQPPPAPPAAQSMAPNTPVALQHRQYSKDAANYGVSSMRMRWGSIHEAATLHCLLQLFPASWVEEVGLCRPQDDALINLGGDPARLPALGASPDGLICHVLDITAFHLLSAAAECGLIDGRDYGYPTVAQPAAAMAYFGSTTGWRRLAGLVIRHALKEHAKRASTTVEAPQNADSADPTTGGSDSRDGAAGSGNGGQSHSNTQFLASSTKSDQESHSGRQPTAPEAAVSSHAGQPWPGCDGDASWRSSGDGTLDKVASAVQGYLASVDGLETPVEASGSSASSEVDGTSGTPAGSAPAAGPCGISASHAYQALKLLEQRLCAPSSSAEDIQGATRGAPSQGDSGCAVCRVTVREVVEVKNHCPFRENRHGVGILTGNSKYVLSDRGPQNQVRFRSKLDDKSV